MHEEKNVLHSSVNVLSSKVLIGDSIFASVTSIAKGVRSFLSYFKALSNGPAPGIEPSTSRSAVKRSTDWAILPRLNIFIPSNIKWSKQQEQQMKNDSFEYKVLVKLPAFNQSLT